MKNTEQTKGEFNEIYHRRDVHLNFMGSILCPLKKKVKYELGKLLDEVQSKKNRKYNCYVADGHGSLTDEYSDYWQTEDIEAFPDIIISKGIDELYRKKLYDRLISKGHFVNINNDMMDRKFIEANCSDEFYTMYGAFLDVLLVDEDKMGNIPKPRYWSDLLDSVYYDEIVVSEKSGEISAAVLMNFYKEFGENGVRKFAINTKSTIHGKKIKEVLETHSEKSGSIYITSYSSAKSLEGDGLKMIVPEDGAAILPFTMLVKREKKEELKFLTDYIIEEYGDSILGLDGISLNRSAKKNDIENINLKWFGWDFVKENDLVELNSRIQSIYRDGLVSD